MPSLSRSQVMDFDRKAEEVRGSFSSMSDEDIAKRAQESLLKSETGESTAMIATEAAERILGRLMNPPKVGEVPLDTSYETRLEDIEALREFMTRCIPRIAEALDIEILMDRNTRGVES